MKSPSLLKNLIPTISPSKRRPSSSIDPPEAEHLVDKTETSSSSFDLELDFQLLQQSHLRLKKWMAFVMTLLVFAIVAMASKDWSMRSEKVVGGKDLRKEYPVPLFPWTTLTFERDDLFSSRSNETTDQAWGSMMPPGDGFLLLPSNLTHPASLPPGKEPSPSSTSAQNTSTATIYDTTLFHQLHCLVHMRTFLSTLTASLPANTTALVWDVLLKSQEEHILHCFDYLRQGLMCAGDVTLEWPRMDEDGRRFAFDGWGVEHQCRDWDSIVDFMMENTVAKWE